MSVKVNEKNDLKLAIEHILTVAQRMSNVLYNYGQHPGVLSARDAQAFMALSKEWDAATDRYRALRPSNPPAPEASP